MKKLLAVVFALVSSIAMAQPFLACDTVVGVAQCGMFLDAAPKVTVGVTPGTPPVCKFNLSAVTTGSHSATCTAISIADPFWGTQESAPSSPFVFVRPATPAVPGNQRLVP